MADFGLYMGLQRKSNIFETKAQNRRMELGIQKEMDQRSQQKLAQQAESQAKVQEFYDTINQIDVLEADRERVQARAQQEKLNVMKGIKSFGGDTSKFMLGGGVSILADYRNNILKSEEVTQAIYNKTNYAQWRDAEAKGLWVKPVGVDVDVMLPDGTMAKEHRTVSMDEAHRLFEQKKIKNLPFDSAEKDIDIGPDFFQKLYKDPRNIYSQDTEVASEDIYNALRSDGASHEQAIQKQQSYEKYRDQGGTPWRYKSGDFLRKAQVDEQIKASRARRAQAARGGAGGSGKNKYVDFLARLKMLPPGKGISLMPEEWTRLAGPTGLGLSFNKDKNSWQPTKGGIKAYDQYVRGENDNPKQYDLTSFDDVQPIEYVMDPKSGRPMLKLAVSYRDDDRVGDDMRPAGESWAGNEWVNDGAHLNNWVRTEANTMFSGTEGGEKWEGEVYVPVDQWTDAWGSMYMNKKIGVQDNMWGEIPNLGTQSNDQWFNYWLEQQQIADQELMNAIGGSYNNAQQQMYSGVMNTTYNQDEYGRPAGGAQEQRQEQLGN